MTDPLSGQRTSDEISLRIAATVHNVDEALTWIVRQLDQHRLDRPQGGFNPITSYSITAEVGQDVETDMFFEVWLTGTPRPEN